MRARVLHHTHARMHVAQVEMIGLNGGGGFPADVSKMEEGGGRHLAAKEGDGEHGPGVVVGVVVIVLGALMTGHAGACLCPRERERERERGRERESERANEREREREREREHA